MEIKLEVLASTCIKQKKPWPRITWLGQEKEAVYLLDEKNINEINLLSGKTKKKIPQLCHLLKNVILLATSRNGAWLSGILKVGELFLWNKDEATVKMVPLAEDVKKVVMATQECSRRFHLYVSGDGNKVLVTTPTVCVFLWENMECQSSPSKNPVAGQWSQIIPEVSIMLPSVEEKETAVSAEFIKTEMLGDICLCSFAFCSEENLMLTFLEIKWQENELTNASRIHWTQQRCCLTNLTPQCEPVKSRGALLTAFSQDGLVLAVGVNQRDLQTSQILFMSTTNFVTVSGSLKGCGAKNNKVPPKLTRSYWIADMSWTSDSLFLACLLKRGSLILMTCLGELLTLVTYGCSVEFGPAEFIPLHPLIMYRSQNSLLQDLNHCHDSSASEGDLMKQRFSITSHPGLPYLITSDGYIVTVLRFSDGFSPSAYMRTLLLDSAQRLEKLRRDLITSKSKEKRLPLQPLSSLRANLLQYHQNQNCSFSAIPKFLQDEKRATEANEETTCVQDYSDDSDEDKMFQTHSFTWGSPKAAISSCEEGRLEFASMFDTIHAADCPREKDDTSLELICIQKNLIAAWRVGISSSVQERDKLLSYTIRCIAHFFNILQYAKLNFVHLGDAVRNRPWTQCVLKCFQQFLTVLSWESKYRHTLGHLMKLTLQTLKLMLDEHNDMFSSNLLGGFSLLKIMSHYLNSKNIPQYATFPKLLNVNSVELDSLSVPLFQEADRNSQHHFCALDSIQKFSPATVISLKNSEKRLIVMWRLLYKHALWYWAELSKKAQNSSQAIKEKLLASEGPVTEALVTHIQAVLQSSGEKLEQTLSLNSVTGEEQFLVGSYKESVEAWERALQEAKAKGGKRMPFLQMRYYLAMLYCHLYHYGLREAQGLCDRLVNELLKRTQISVRDRDEVSDAEWTIKDVATEAALAVVQSLARFMAAYFTNEPLYILPPHSVDILPPLHIRPDRCPRVILLEHATVTDAVRHQGLSGVWTVEYALDLLLVGGLIPEAVWLTHKLGDWKMAVSVGVAFNLYCQSDNRFSRVEKVDLCLPPHLSPTQIFQEKLQSFLGQAVNHETTNQGDSTYKQLTDPIEEEDAGVLFNSVEEILKAAVMAEADIVSETFLLLVDFAKELSRKLNGLVPDTLYLPAPPLYCPQPALPNQEEYTDLLLTMERNCRQKVSGVIQRLLLLFRAAHCSFPAAQWYIAQLKRTRKIMQKIRQKVALPPLSALPENLLNYSKYGTVFLKPTSSGDHKLDDVSCKTIACFRELCALCWMLHVREMLSDSCRRYQTAREKMENQTECKSAEFDACVVERSLSALEWANRMLPFAHFMNVEELVQDIILSLTGELPPIKKVAEILVKAFPNPEVVRVPLRDKYSAVQRRFQHCIVKGPSSEEMMSVVIQAAHKVNVKTLKCVMRNIGPYEKNIWEPPEEEAHDPGACCYDKLSLGTSLSRSTISDLGSSQICSDAETGESLSEALLAEETKKHLHSQMQENRGKIHHEQLIRCNKTAEKFEGFNEKERRNKKESSKDMTHQHALPLVGEWEFERDDDEYVKFLDLFLTYILERDLTDHRQSVIPFLVSFSPLLREYELNSFLFDVHTTLKRRQIRSNGPNVFRAGSCYATVFEPSASELALLHDERKRESKERTPPVTIQQAIEPSNHESVMRLPARRGLFGLSQQSSYSTHGSNKNRTHTPALTQHWSEQASSAPQKVPVHKCIYKVIQTNDVIQREEPTPEMKLKFSNIAHLLEWLIRWSDKRLLYDPVSRQPFQECQPTMHVKISTSAVLASLWLLEYYSNKSEDRNTCFSELHRPSASICSSTLRSKTEKDSSLDAGRSPSAGTSIGIPDSHAYGKPSEDAPGTLKEKQSEKKKTDFKGHSVTRDKVIGGTDCDVVLPEEMGEFTPSKVEVTSENEDYCEDPFAVSRSPTISVSVKSVQQRKEHQSLSDIQYPQKDVFVKTLERNFTKLESITCEAIPSNVPCSSCPEMKAESTSSKMTVSDNQPSFTAVSSALSSDSSGPKHEEIGAREPISQPTAQLTAPPLNTSDAVREMLQDEMFKLVQLQQINFMSLMQVVGASFANLPSVSLQTQQPWPFQSERSQTPNLAGIDVKRSSPRHPADGFLKAQMANLENSCPASTQNIRPREGDDIHDQQSRNGYVLNPPHTNDSSNLQESQSNGKRQTPPFQGLLHQMPARPLPLLSADLKDEKKPKLIPLAKPLNNAGGLPLLKLKPQDELQPFRICPVTPPKFLLRPQLQPKECWAAPAPFVENHQGGATACLNLNNYDHKAVRQTQEQTNNRAEILSKETCKQPHLGKYGKTEDVSLHHFHAHLREEKSLADNEMLLQKTYEHFTQFPLLYLKPRLQSKPLSTSITIKCAGKDQDSSEPCGQTALPLLYAKLSPPIKFQTPKLIPLQNLIAFEQRRHIAQYEFHKEHKGCPEQIQLLKADINFQEARQERNNKKRQKRRVEREIREKKERKKTAVNFQQEDAVGSADTVKQTKVNQVEFSYDFSDGDSLLNRDAINVAGLHYLASVRKRAVEFQDASTNTDTVLTSHQDMQTPSEEVIHKPDTNQLIPSVSACVPGLESHRDVQDKSEEINSELTENKPITSPSACDQEPLPSHVPRPLPPDLYMHLTFPTEAAEKPLPPSSDIASDLIGQKYISVIDIENDGDLNNLPDISESLPKSCPTQAVKTELPTSAKLHHMAASITNVIPPEEFEKKGDTFQTESLQVLPETVESKIAQDPLTLRLLREDFSISDSSTGLLARKMSREHLSAKLREMDRQLLMLQNVAGRMEKEFHDTQLLVETIEDVGVIADPENNDISFFAPGVKVTKEEHYSIHEVMENSAEAAASESKSFLASYVDLRTPSVSPSVSAATLRIKKSSSDINFRRGELDESFSDRLQMTGLSGVSDIITDLIAEGGISAAELGLTETQAKKISSFSSVASNYSPKTQRDKKELQSWMKRKRKERLAEYMQTLAERRAKEHSPFPVRKNTHLALSTRDIKMQQKKKDEKDKALFSEHHSRRVSEALVLMHELLSDTVQLPSSDYKQTPKITSPHGFKRPCIASAESYRGRRQAARKTVAAKAGFSESKSFSSLSSDITQRRGRLSRAPYRRMASGSFQAQMQGKSSRSQKPLSSGLLDLPSQASSQTRKLMNQRRLPTAETTTQASEESDDGAVSSWRIPDEIQQILYGSSNFNKETLSQEEDCSIASLNHFDSVSESTSSILSKLDWKAVEAMVAGVEEK